MKLESQDPVLTMLSDLTAPAPRAARDSLVRARCHAAMRSETGGRLPSAHRTLRTIDRLLPVAVVVYGIVTLVEGLRLAGVL